MNNSLWLTEKALEYYETHNMTEMEKEVVLKYAKGKKNCLEVGCATGKLTNWLYQNGIKNIQGIEISPLMVERARKNFPYLDITIGDVTELKYSDESLDFIFFNCLDYLYPYSKRAEAISEIMRVLKPNGIFLCNLHIKKIFRKSGYQEQETAIGNFKVYHLSKDTHIWAWSEIYGFKPLEIIHRFRNDKNPFFVFQKEIEK